MKGPGGAIGSLSESIDFNPGSASSNAARDQQIHWNNLKNLAEDRLPDSMLPSSNTTISHLNSVGHEGHNLDRWSLDEPSSSNSQKEAHPDEPERDHGWSYPLIASTGASPRLVERYEPENFLSLDNVSLNFHNNEIANGSLLLQSPRFDAIPENIDINARLQFRGEDDCKVLEHPNLYESSKLLNEQISYASSSSDPFGSHSRSGRHFAEENDTGPDCSLRGRHFSCKRKILEGVGGQFYAEGSTTFQHGESSDCRAAPVQSNAGSSLSLPTLSNNVPAIGTSDQVISRPGIVAGVSSGSGPISVSGSAQGFQRNSRMRVNSHQQDSMPPNLFSRESDNGHLNISSPAPSMRLLPNAYPRELGSAQCGDSTSSQDHSFVVRVPPQPRSGQSFRWHGASSSRPSNSSTLVASGVTDAPLREEFNPTSMPRNVLGHPLFIPMTELRTSTENETNLSITGGRNVASTSRTGLRSGINSPSASSRVPHRNSSPQYPRRLSELVHRSLMQSSVGSDSAGQAGNQGSFQSYARSALLLDRQSEGIIELPYPLRNLSTAFEGRRRIVSEIRNALDLVRRGEGMRFEDQLMIFDHPAFFGAADALDRHWDNMRLDVDNMSYEELLALEERIGNVSTGLSEETISNHLKQRKFSSAVAMDMEPCCICQEDYGDGEDLGILDCGHEFHGGCIKQWLMHKNSCPICKTTGLRIQ